MGFNSGFKGLTKLSH